MNDLQLKEYLHRIAYKGTLEPTLETLGRVQAAQAYSIPFETFDILMGRPIVLNYENLFTKLVKEKRGGYCYEVNALLYFALEAIGFKASLCLARLTDDDGNVLPESVHMIIIVELKQRWLVDVGWGNGFIEPFCLDKTCSFQKYRIEKDDDKYSFYHEEKKLYHFTLEKLPLDFFETRNLYHQFSPKSLFANEIFCSMPTPCGYKMIRANIYIQKIEEKIIERTIMSDSEYRMVLSNAFGLQLEVNRPIWMQHEGFCMHTPRNKSDWDAYHGIRIEQIHKRYCPELIYDPNDPEEKDVSNFPLVFRKEGQDQIIGTIRIDLLAKNEASFRWIAIDVPFIRKGFGSKMLQIAEQFVRERARKVIRIPATQESLAFAHHMAYSQEPWALMPKEECMIAVCKHI